MPLETLNQIEMYCVLPKVQCMPRQHLRKIDKSFEKRFLPVFETPDPIK